MQALRQLRRIFFMAHAFGLEEGTAVGLPKFAFRRIIQFVPILQTA